MVLHSDLVSATDVCLPDDQFNLFLQCDPGILTDPKTSAKFSALRTKAVSSAKVTDIGCAMASKEVAGDPSDEELTSCSKAKLTSLKRKFNKALSTDLSFDETELVRSKLKRVCFCVFPSGIVESFSLFSEIKLFCLLNLSDGLMPRRLKKRENGQPNLLPRCPIFLQHQL